MALRMWPMWMLGILMMVITIVSGHKDLLRVDKAGLKWFGKILVSVTIARLILFSLLWQFIAHRFAPIAWLPWETTLMVFWEDAAVTLPLLLLMRFIGTSKKTWPIHGFFILLMMTAFGSGHLYQGIGSAVFISAYVPVTLWVARKKGLGTVMICHILYDLCTILLIQGMMKVLS